MQPILVLDELETMMNFADIQYQNITINNFKPKKKLFERKESLIFDDEETTLENSEISFELGNLT